MRHVDIMRINEYGIMHVWAVRQKRCEEGGVDSSAKQRCPAVDWLGTQRASFSFMRFTAIIAGFMQAGVGLLRHDNLGTCAKNTPSLLLICIWLQV